jgi:hypothetical protein
MGILNVTKERVKKALVAGFPNTYNESNFKESAEYKNPTKRTKMYKLENKDNTGCVISVKIPNPNIAGEALHLSTIYKNKKGQEYIVYPSKHSKVSGRGRFKSKTIPRTKNWRRNLMTEANTGFILCKTVYESDEYISPQKRQQIYNLMDKRKDLILERFEIDDKLKNVTRESSKKKYNDKRKKIKREIRKIGKTLGIDKKKYKL